MNNYPADNDLLTGFPPVIDHDCRVLILGSMPGSQSLAQKQYYAHPRNQFWRLMSELFGADPNLDYQRRLEFLLSCKIALWDVVQQCRRQGSLDTSIRDVRVNDFSGLFFKFPCIEMVFCNGRRAADLYQRHVLPDNRPSGLVVLPSSSPAHTISFSKKLEAWRQIELFLIDSQ